MFFLHFLCLALFRTHFADSKLWSTLIEFIIFIIKSEKSFKKSDLKKFMKSAWLKTLTLFSLFKHSAILVYEDILILKDFWFISLFKKINSDSTSELWTVIEESEHLTIFLKNHLAVISSHKHACFIWKMYFDCKFLFVFYFLNWLCVHNVLKAQ